MEHNQNEPTSVYVLTCEGRVKIGVAAVVKTRVEHLQLACPLPIMIAHERRFETRTNARLVERSLHARFGDKRLHGEWFEMDPAEAIAAVTAAEETAAPVTIPGRLTKPVLPAPKPRSEPKVPPSRITGDGPTWDEYEAMDDATWSDFMRPAAATLDFMNPNAREDAARIEAGLRIKYPRFYDRVTTSTPA